MIETFGATLAEMAGFVPRTVLIMFCSITATYLIIRHGFLGYLSRVSRPVTYVLRLPEQVAATTVLAFGSALSANIMLSEFRDKKIISEDDTYVGAILNGISVTIKEIFTYQLPVIIPILGIKAGTVYFFCFTSAAVIKYIYICLYLRIRRGAWKVGHDGITAEEPVPEVALSYKRQLKTFARCSSVYVTVTFVILFALNAGLTDYFEKLVRPVTGLLDLPAALGVPVATFIFSPIAGVSAIGSLITSHSITDIDAALAVTVGSLLLLPIYMLRGNMSRSISIFGTKLGVRIVITSTGLTMLSRLIFIVAILSYKGAVT